MSDPRAERQFAFKMRVVEKDREGYYHPRWDRATPVTVEAPNREAAFEACWALMGQCPRGRGWTWTAVIDNVAQVSHV